MFLCSPFSLCSPILAQAEIETSTPSSWPFLSGLVFVIALAQAGYIGWLFWERARYRKLDQTYRQHDRQFQRIFNSGPVAIGVLDSNTLRLVNANSRFCEMHGYREGEMLQMHLKDFTPPEDYAQELEKIQGLLRGEIERYSMEKREFRKDGEVLWLRVSGSPLRGKPDEPPLLVGILEEITAEKLIREALRKSQEQLRTLINNVPGGVFRCKVGGTWSTIFATEGVTTLTGYSVSDYLAETFDYTSIVHPEDLHSFFATMQNALDTHSIYEMIYRVYHADGSIRWLHERGCGVYDSQGQPIYVDGVAVDVTERHLAEEALRESEMRFRTLAENLPDVICRVDSSLKFIYLNPAIEKASGTKITNYIHKTIAETDVPVPLKEMWEQKTKEVFSSAKPQTTEFEFLTPSGSRIFHSLAVPEFAIDGTVQTVLVVSRDITDIFRIEKELDQKTKEVDSFFNASLDLMCIADTQGYFRRLNPVWEKTLGYPIDEMVGKQYLEFIHPDDIKRTQEAMHTLVSQQSTFNFTNRYRTRDGSYRWIEWVSQTMGNSVYAAARDITDRLTSEAERLNLERRLQESQRMESLGVLAGGIAHEFNNLLTVILGNLDLIDTALGTGSGVHAELSEASQAARRAAALTRQMLAYVGKGRFVVQDVNINSLINELPQLLPDPIYSSTQVTLDLQEQLPLIHSDPSQLKQIITSLFMNAVEAIGQRAGIITIRTRLIEVDKEFLAVNQLEQEISTGKFVSIRVSDTGCGMSPEVLRKVFDPFFSTKFAGRGLGMSAVLGIVHAHQGAIILKSEEGEGTTVEILLPSQVIQK